MHSLAVRGSTLSVHVLIWFWLILIDRTSNRCTKSYAINQRVMAVHVLEKAPSIFLLFPFLLCRNFVKVC